MASKHERRTSARPLCAPCGFYRAARRRRSTAPELCSVSRQSGRGRCLLTTPKKPPKKLSQGPTKRHGSRMQGAKSCCGPAEKRDLSNRMRKASAGRLRACGGTFTRNLLLSDMEVTRRGLQNVFSGNCRVSRCACLKVQLLPPPPRCLFCRDCCQVIQINTSREKNRRIKKAFSPFSPLNHFCLCLNR